MKSHNIDESATHFEKLVEATKKYIELRLQSYRLSGLEQLASTGSLFLTLGLLLVILLFSFIFVNLSVAVIVSDLLGSMAFGFGLFGAFYLLLAICFIILRKKMRYWLLDKFLLLIISTIEDDDDEIE